MDLRLFINITILTIGLGVYTFVISAQEFTYAIIVAGFTMISWVGYMLIIEKNNNYKLIANTILVAGILVAISTFIVFGIEQVAFPRGSFQFKSSGIAKSLSVILFSLIPALMLYVVENNFLQIQSKKVVSLSSKKEKQPVENYDKDEWEEVSEEELETGEYEPV